MINSALPGSFCQYVGQDIAIMESEPSLTTAGDSEDSFGNENLPEAMFVLFSIINV